MASANPEQKAVLYGIAEGIGGMLRDRWHTKQMEGFIGNELAKFQADSSAILDTINQDQDPDSDNIAQAFSQYGQKVFVPFMSQVTMKYADNPKIMAAVQRIDQEMRGQLDVFMKAAEMGQEQQKIDIAAGDQATSAAKEKRLGEEAAIMSPLKQESEIALADSRRAQAELARARADKLGMEQETTDDPAAIVKKARMMKGVKEREDFDKRTLEDIMSRIVSKNRATPYPSGTGVWGSDPEKDRAEALNDLRSRGVLDDVLTAGRAMQLGGDKAAMAQALYDSAIDTDAIQLVFPEVTGLANIPEEKMRGKINDRTSGTDIVSVITGTPGSQFESLEEFKNTALPDSFRNLPEPLRGVFTSIETNQLGLPISKELVKDEKGNFTIKKRQINNPVDLKNELKRMANWKVSQMVDPSSKLVKKDIDNFFDEIIEKYYPEIRRQFMTPEQIRLEEESNSPIERWLNTAAESLSKTPGAGVVKKGYTSIVRPGAEKTLKVLKNLLPEDENEFREFEEEMARMDKERKRKK